MSLPNACACIRACYRWPRLTRLSNGTYKSQTGHSIQKISFDKRNHNHEKKQLGEHFTYSNSSGTITSSIHFKVVCRYSSVCCKLNVSVRDETDYSSVQPEDRFQCFSALASFQWQHLCNRSFYSLSVAHQRPNSRPDHPLWPGRN